MPWPAPDLPVNFANATVSQDTHPNAHNATNISLNNNYRPELTRVGAAIDGTRTVYLGANPTTDAAIIRTNGVLQRQNAIGTPQGDIASHAGIAQASGTALGATSGPSPALALQVQFLQGFPNGGTATITATARFTPSAANPGVAFVVPGFKLNSDGAPIGWFNSLSADGGYCADGIPTVGSVTLHFAIPPNTTDVWGCLGVFDTGESLLVNSGYIELTCWRY